MDDSRIFAAQLRQDLPTLDLHGLYPAEALDKLEIFLYNAFQKKESAAKIIYGIGTGRLQKAILEVVCKHPLVHDVVEQSGSCVVVFSY